MQNRYIIVALNLVISAVFLFSAITKIVTLGFFEVSLIEQGVTADRQIAALLARFLIGFESALGFALLLPYYRKKIVIPATVTALIGFTVFLVLSWLGATSAENCGCFGNVIELSTGESILKNVVLLILTVLFYNAVGEDKQNWRIPAALALVCQLVVFLALPAKSQEPSVFAKYQNFEPIGSVDLLSGDKIIGVLDPNCEHCIEYVLELGFLTGEFDNHPEIYFLFGSKNDTDIENFFETTQTRFPYTKISSEEMFALIGAQTPRFYWLRNGEIKAYWDEDIISELETLFQMQIAERSQ